MIDTKNQTKIQYQPLDNNERVEYINLCRELNIKVDCKLIEVDGKKVIGYKVLETVKVEKEEEKPLIKFSIEPVQKETNSLFIISDIDITNREIPTTFNNYQYCETCKTECSHTLFRNLLKCNECKTNTTIGV